ncbi:MerR family transcriptional regulator [Asticcacaulis sp. EMRT-3]|uniref:MerR family transcriptional regulator n=1 Tax=Asticcacaulis sp. EMRT-3 TaxID=3040349 RepID=UPI0024AEBF96|nr:MerR family transcriptional regulator [Asticcacaulis sp. EMRT-3]MDI7774418.1 MerR family transcriptional regulator [Asticcacaulis sp. EMRT-3]
MSKGPLALRTISEAADSLGVPQHVLRFWETKFTFIRPTKRAGGRRFYRPQDVDLLIGVKTLLYDRGYTIRGVQKLFKDEGQKAILSASHLPASHEPEQAGVAHQVSQPVEGETADADMAGHTPVMSADVRARLLDIARRLEAAQTLLGRQIGRDTKRGKFSSN